MKRPSLRKRQVGAQGALVQRRQSFEHQSSHRAPPAFDDRHDHRERGSLFDDPRRPDPRVVESLEGVERTQVREIGAQLLIHESAALGQEESPGRSAHQGGEAFRGKRFVALECQLLEGEALAGANVESQLDGVGTPTLRPLHHDSIVPALLIVRPDPLDRLQHQRVVVASFVEERKKVALLEILEPVAGDDDFEPEARFKAVDEIDDALPRRALLGEPFDFRRAIAAFDQVLLQSLEVLAQGAAAIRVAGPGTKRLQELEVGEPARRALEADLSDPRPRAGGDAIEDACRECRRVDRDFEVDGGFQVALLDEEVLQRVETAHDAILQERLSGRERNHGLQPVRLEPQIPLKLHGGHAGRRPDRDDGHDAVFHRPLVDRHFGGETRKAQGPQRATHARLLERLSRTQRDQAIDFVPVDGGVASHLDLADDRLGRPRRSGGEGAEDRTGERERRPSPQNRLPQRASRA